MAKERSFLGTGWGFPPTFVRGQGVVMTSDEDDVRASLEILLATEVGERVMQPRYGCNLHRLLFEPLDLTLRTYMKDLIRTAILYFEPRVILDDVTFELVSAEGRIDIRVEYTIAKTNARNNFVYPFYLVEGSQVER
ncbi:MAG TPA: GPW/gp25 family protein [Thermoanaerobaculia bacterium]